MHYSSFSASPMLSTLPDLSTELLPESAIDAATIHLRDVLNLAIEYTPQHAAVVVSDAGCALAQGLTTAYRRCLPGATFIDFDAVAPEQIQALFATLSAGDLVVLVQSTNFRLDAYRIRVELFKRGLKVIEHPHLARMPGQQSLHYIAALAYDQAYYRGTGMALKERIDRAGSAVLDSGGELLVFGGPLESAKINIGDYRNMTNVGGQFPIGEVFTEARDLEAVNGRVRIFVFGDTAFSVNQPAQPITLVISRGRVVEAIDSTPEFDQVLANIRADEGEVWLRELGFGMNRAFSKDCTVSDIGTFERMCGIHLSLGAKHGIYPKAGFKRGVVRHHVDVFAVTQSVRLDDEEVYRDGAWVVAAPEQT
ncbi:MAG: aminopeptidase [Bradyrhizobium sp.]|jgi:aminopeptidase